MLQSNCLLRLQKTHEKFKKKPLPPVFKTRIDGPSSEWKIFKRLQLASEFADSYVTDCMIFSYEGSVDNSGLRLFLVAHPVHMWSCYKIRPSNEKCSYEVIRENHPCKLYFDLEFYTAFNPCKDGTLMTKVFIKCVIAAMFDIHSIEAKESDILWLDSSNPQKYSCHLILQLKGIAFQNNYHAGIFVSKLLCSLRIRMRDNCSGGLWPSAEEIKNLLVFTKNGNYVLFCDDAVYSKNRNFRLYLSTKPGKASPLLLSSHNQYIPSNIGKDRDETIFYDSLITYFRNQQITKVLKYENEDSNSSSCHSLSTGIPSTRQSVSSCLPSPFSNLDSFILEIIKDDIAAGYIRKWKLITSEQKIIYDICNYRFCHNIGRHHMSNNIRLIVDLKARFYYQICLDPECRHFQSEAFKIPEEISFISVPDDFFDDIAFTQLPLKETVTEALEPDNSKTLVSSKPHETPQDDLDVPDNLFNEEDGFFNSTSAQESKSMNDIGKSFSPEPQTVKVKKNSPEPLDIDFCDINDEFWNMESTSCDSLENVSYEDELLMVDAAEATEAAMVGFNEETIF